MTCVDLYHLSKPAAIKYVRHHETRLRHGLYFCAELPAVNYVHETHLRHGLYFCVGLPAVNYVSKPAAIKYIKHHETHLRHGLYLCAGLPAVN